MVLYPKSGYVCTKNEREIQMKKIPYNKESLMKLVKELYAGDDFIVAQQMSETYSDGGHKVTTELGWFDNVGAKHPAMLGFDIAHAVNEYGEEDLDVLAGEFIDYASEGGIVTLCGHFRNPHLPNPDDKTYYRGHLGMEDEWEAVMNPETPTGKVFKDDLDKVCRFLKKLDDAGVPVLWRPLHEMNGNWFWFCVGQYDWGQDPLYIPKEYAERMWRYIYKVCTEEFGLKHLIWVFSPNVGCKEGMYCYPGDDVVDIVAFDWYPGSIEIPDSVKNDYKNLCETGKPFAIGEFGPGNNRTDYAVSPEDKFNNLDALRMFRDMNSQNVRFAWVMFWSSWAQVKISVHNMKYADKLMNAPEVYNLDRVKDYFDKH